MNSLKFLLSFLIIVALAACSTVSVSTDYDPEVDFSQYKTYRWYEGKPVPGDELAKAPLIQKRVMAGIDKALQEKGFEKTDSDAADIVIVIHAGIKDRMQITNYGSYGWYDPWWGGYGGYTDVSHYEEGTLVIDIVDTNDKELVWRGLGTKTVGGTDQEVVDNTVARILRDFPPMPK